MRKLKLMMLLASLVAIIGSAVAAPMQNKKAKVVVRKTTPTPTPTFTSVTVNLGAPKVADDIAMLYQLSIALKKYPKQEEVITRWIIFNNMDYPADGKLVYNRRHGTLNYVYNWSNFFRGSSFDHVTDKSIHSAGKVPRAKLLRGRTAPVDQSFRRVLLQFGCKFTGSYAD